MDPIAYTLKKLVALYLLRMSRFLNKNILPPYSLALCKGIELILKIDRKGREYNSMTLLLCKQP